MGKASRTKQERAPVAAEIKPAPRAAPRRVAVASPPRARGGALAVAAPLLVALAVAAVYANTFSIPFLFDDYFGITRNPLVQKYGALHEYLQSRGLLLWTFALNHVWSGEQVWSYHAVNFAVHLLNSVLVYALVLATLRLPRLAARYGRDDRLLALLVALVFAVHPLQTMAVSYISQRAESMAALFYLLALLLYRLGAVRSGWQRIACQAAMVVAAVLGVLCKETVVTLALAVPLYHACFLAEASPDARSSERSGFARFAPYALLLLPLAFGLYLSRTILLPSPTGGEPRAWLFIPTAGFGLKGVTPWSYLITQFGVILWYLRLYLLPTRQCFDYGWPLLHSPWRADVLLPGLALVAIAAAGVLAYRRYRLAAFCIGWLFLTLAPTSSILPLNDVAFEHRMYLTVFGLSFLLVLGGRDLLDWLARGRGLEPGQARLAWMGVVGVRIALLGVLAVARNGVYQDVLTLAADSAAKSPDNWRSHFEWGTELQTRGRLDEAIPVLEKAVELDPTRGTPRVQLGSIYAQRGRLDDAVEMLRPATHVDEESVAAAARRTLANVYLAKKDPLNAINELEEAKKLMPRWTSIRVQLGHLYVAQGEWFPAAGNFNEAIKANPSLAASLESDAINASYRAGAQFLENGQPNAAVKMLQIALDHNPALVDARYRLALAYAAKQWWGKAEQEISNAKDGRPDDPQIQADFEWISRMRAEAEKRSRDRAHPPAAAPAAD